MTRHGPLPRVACVVAALAALALATGVATASVEVAGAAVEPAAPVGHVFVVVLENKDYDVTFGPESPAPYLSQTLVSQGQLLTQYHGIGHVSLDNYIAMISGQAPNPVTQSDCQNFTDFVPPDPVIDPNGQAIGQGCVYPASVPNVVDQLEAAGRTWRGYFDGMGTPCRHPDLGANDDTQSAEVGDQYATRHNPFMYFHSIIDDAGRCASHVVDLSELPDDLAAADSTPGYVFIAPDLCHDGHDEPCVDGQPGGLASADAFLQEWVPQILSSEAFGQDGLLVITFDEAEPGSPDGAAACCGEIPGPNSPMPGIYGLGGGRVGAVLLSPFITAGSVNDTPYNHYALLRTVEDIFGLDHLGFAAADGLAAFGADVFGATQASTTTTSTTSTTSTPAPSTTIAAAPAAGELARTGGGPPTALLIAVAAAALVAIAARRQLR